MSVNPQEIFERYTWATMTRDADAVAGLFTEDGVVEAPLAQEGDTFPPRIEGRENLRRFLADYYQRTADDAPKVNVGESRYVLHTTPDPDVFVTEIDVMLDVDGEAVPMALVRIYRLRDGKIALLRDYFAAAQAN